MSWLHPFVWGAATGYVISAIEDAVHEIRKAKREAKAKIEEARRRYDRT